jgi:hypothetical protein
MGNSRELLSSEGAVKDRSAGDGATKSAGKNLSRLQVSSAFNPRKLSNGSGVWGLDSGQVADVLAPLGF